MGGRDDCMRGPRRIVASLLVVCLALLVSACDRPAPWASHGPSKPALIRVVFPAEFVKRIFIVDDRPTPEDVARTFRGQHEYYSDSRAGADGSVTCWMTERQRRRGIAANDEQIHDAEKLFMRSNASYRYEVAKDRRSMSIWADKHLGMYVELGILHIVPGYSGYNYYLDGGKGDWDMRIDYYSCHSGRLMQTVMFSRIADLSLPALPE